MSKTQRTNCKKKMKQARLKMMKAVASKSKFSTTKKWSRSTPRCPTDGPGCPKFFPNGIHDIPKSSQNPPKSLPKSTQNRSRTPLGAHFGPMLNKSSILNNQKMAKRHPRAPKRRRRASQTPPKWRPRPCQIHFLSIFLIFVFLFKICIDFLWIFV